MRYLLLILLSCTLAIAQSPVIDSLQRRLGQLPTDSSRVNGLYELSLAYWRGGNDSLARLLLNEAIRLAKQVKYPRGEARAHIYLARIEADYLSDPQTAHAHLDTANRIATSLGDRSLQAMVLVRRAQLYEDIVSKGAETMALFRKALLLFQRAGDKKGEALVYNELARMKSGEGQYAEAIDLLLKARRLQEAEQDWQGLRATIPNLGVAYLQINRFEEALASFTDAERVADRLHDDMVRAHVIGQRASIMEKKSHYTEALQLYLRQAQQYEAHHTNSQLPRVYANIGRMHIYLKDYHQALHYSQLAQDTYRANVGKSQDALLHGSQVNFGRIYLALKQYDRVVTYARTGLEWTDDILEMRPERTEYNRQLAEAYEHLGQPAKALHHFQQYKANADTMLNEEAIHKATAAGMNYEFEVKQKAALAEQQKRNAVTSAQQLALLVGLGFTLILAVVAIYAFRNKQKANALLRQQKEEIERTLAKLTATQAQLIQKEKMASLGELTAGIAHEIQNPLNFVNNFSEVSVELVQEMQGELANMGIAEKDKDYLFATLTDLSRNQQKIHHHGQRADSIVKGMLQHSRASTGEKQLTDINALAEEYLQLSYHGFRAKDHNFNASLATDFDDGLGKVRVVPQELGRVLLNLFNNAFYITRQKVKQVGNGYQPQVKVSTKGKNGKVEIRIRDNGMGIPQKEVDKIFQPFFTTKPTGQGTGLGLSLSYDIITKGHGGELKVITEEGEFAEFIIALPTE